MSQKSIASVAALVVWLVASGCSSGGAVPLFPDGHANPGDWEPQTVAVRPVDYHTTHHGYASWYAANQMGNCSYDVSADFHVAALSDGDYDGSFACGAWIRVHGPKGSVDVRVVDRCQSCADGDIDLAAGAFNTIATMEDGLAEITWQFIEGKVQGPMRYRLKTGSNKYWSALQVLNHRHAISGVAIKLGNGTWRPLTRQSYNYWEYENGMGQLPRDIQVTDAFGQVALDQAVPLRQAVSVPGTAQLPSLNGTTPDPVAGGNDNETGSSIGEAPGTGGGSTPGDNETVPDDTGGTGTGTPAGPVVPPGIEYDIEEDDWGTGLCADVVLLNVSEQPIEWFIEIPADLPVALVWGAAYVNTGTSLEFVGFGGSGVIPAGGKYDFGYCLGDAGAGAPPSPSSD